MLNFSHLHTNKQLPTISKDRRCEQSFLVLTYLFYGLGNLIHIESKWQLHGFPMSFSEGGGRRGVGGSWSWTNNSDILAYKKKIKHIKLFDSERFIGEDSPLKAGNFSLELRLPITNKFKPWVQVKIVFKEELWEVSAHADRGPCYRACTR